MEEVCQSKKFFLPDGKTWVVIREQNGEDDDIISNPVKAEDLSNFSEFISRIVIDTNYTASGKITEEVARKMPVNLHYAIIMHSRIFSLGDTFNFSYNWADGMNVEYEQDLKELVFNDYSKAPTEEELLAKPYAIPYYPLMEQKLFYCDLPSGKKVRYHLLDVQGEAMMMNTQVKTKNLEIKARGLELEVNGVWEKVQNFSLFSVKDMAFIRKSMAETDPVYLGYIDIEHPITKIKQLFSVMGVPDFFYMGGL